MLGALALPAAGHATAPPGYQALGPAITIDMGKTTPTATGFDLSTGTRYKIEVTGTWTDENTTGQGYDYDPLYCYHEFGTDPGTPDSCQPPTQFTQVWVGIGSGKLEAVDSHQQPSGPSSYDPPYSSGHDYTLDYWPQSTGELMAGGYFAYSGCKNMGSSSCQDTINGTVTLQVFAPASSSGTPGGSGGGGRPCGGAARDASAARAKRCVLISKLPVPAGFGDPISGEAPGPDGAALVQSPPLGDQSSVEVSFAGLPDISYIGVVGAEAARHKCYVTLAKNLITTLNNATPQARKQIALNFATDAAAVSYGLGTTGQSPAFTQLLTCLAWVYAVEQRFSSTTLATDAAASSCALDAVNLSIAGTGSMARLKRFRLVGSGPLRTSCSATSSGLAISVSTRAKGKPLSSVVGPSLPLAIVGGAQAAAGHQMSVTFNSGAPPNLTGSWVNQADTSSPPWQLTTSNQLQTLDATWTGGAGHSGLRGTFHGSLSQPNGEYAYTGNFTITEGSSTVTGTMYVVIDDVGKVEIYLQPSGGQVQHYTFVRTS